MSEKLPAAPQPRPTPGTALEGSDAGRARVSAPFADRAMGATEGRTDWRRYLAAVLRYKWLVLLVTVVGTAGGVGFTRFIQPQYVAQATIWIEVSPQAGGGQLSPGPIRTGQLVSALGWIDLLRSYIVLDEVVRQRRLYLSPKSAGDSAVLEGLTLRERFVPGDYVLEVAGSGDRFLLTSAFAGGVLQQGRLGDSVGPALGFLWVPPAAQLRPGRKIEFGLTTPRDAALQLADNLKARIRPSGSGRTCCGRAAGSGRRR